MKFFALVVWLGVTGIVDANVKLNFSNSLQVNVGGDGGSGKGDSAVYRNIGGDRQHVLITGANKGLGLETALALAGTGRYDVTLVCRDAGRCQEAHGKVLARAQASPDPYAGVHWELIDLASFQSVLEFVDKVRNNVGGQMEHRYRYDILVLNAGVFGAIDTTADGFDITFQSNYLSHYLLARWLLHLRTPPERPMKVITITSMLYDSIDTQTLISKAAKTYGPINTLSEGEWRKQFNEPNKENRLWEVRAYALSKLAMAILAVRLNGLVRGVRAVTVDPGCVGTEMIDAALRVGHFANLPDMVKDFCKWGLCQCGQLKQPIDAAAHIVYAVDHIDQFGLLEYRKEGANAHLAETATSPSQAAKLIAMSNWFIEDWYSRNMLNAARPGRI